MRKLVTEAMKVAQEHNVTVKVISGHRTWEEQDALYAKGRTKPGKRVTNARGGYSNHNFGTAVDFAVFKGSVYLDGGNKSQRDRAIFTARDAILWIYTSPTPKQAKEDIKNGKVFTKAQQLNKAITSLKEPSGTATRLYLASIRALIDLEAIGHWNHTKKPKQHAINLAYDLAEYYSEHRAESLDLLLNNTPPNKATFLAHRQLPHLKNFRGKFEKSVTDLKIGAELVHKPLDNNGVRSGFIVRVVRDKQIYVTIRFNKKDSQKRYVPFVIDENKNLNDTGWRGQ